MRKLQLVTQKYPSDLTEGIFVIPQMGSNLKFNIGIIRAIEQNYIIVSIDGDIIRIIPSKLQPVRLYLVDKEDFSPGDWYYYPPDVSGKKTVVEKDYNARVGKIHREIDAKLFNLCDAKKIIYGPESIGYTRSKHEVFDVSIGDLIKVDARVLGRTLGNNGECWVEDQLIDGKVVMFDEPIQ